MKKVQRCAVLCNPRSEACRPLQPTILVMVASTALTKCAILRVSTLVFPDPGPATTLTAPTSAKTASRCESFSSSSSAAAGCKPLPLLLLGPSSKAATGIPTLLLLLLLKPLRLTPPGA